MTVYDIANFQAWVATIGIVVNAFGVLCTLYLSSRTHRAVVQAKEDIKVVEIATNSMKDALVAATARASELEGAERGRAEVASTLPTPPS